MEYFGRQLGENCHIYLGREKRSFEADWDCPVEICKDWLVQYQTKLFRSAYSGWSFRSSVQVGCLSEFYFVFWFVVLFCYSELHWNYDSPRKVFFEFRGRPNSRRRDEPEVEKPKTPVPVVQKPTKIYNALPTVSGLKLDQKLLATLIEMGFDRGLATQALQESDNGKFLIKIFGKLQKTEIFQVKTLNTKKSYMYK